MFSKALGKMLDAFGEDPGKSYFTRSFGPCIDLERMALTLIWFGFDGWFVFLCATSIRVYEIVV
jgi:hypothetical protein